MESKNKTFKAIYYVFWFFVFYASVSKIQSKIFLYSYLNSHDISPPENYLLSPLIYFIFLNFSIVIVIGFIKEKKWSYYATIIIAIYLCFLEAYFLIMLSFLMVLTMLIDKNKIAIFDDENDKGMLVLNEKLLLLKDKVINIKVYSPKRLFLSPIISLFCIIIFFGFKGVQALIASILMVFLGIVFHSPVFDLSLVIFVYLSAVIFANFSINNSFFHNINYSFLLLLIISIVLVNFFPLELKETSNSTISNNHTLLIGKILFLLIYLSFTSAIFRLICNDPYFIKNKAYSKAKKILVSPLYIDEYLEKTGLTRLEVDKKIGNGEIKAFSQDNYLYLDSK